MLMASGATVEIFFFNDTATTEIYTLSLHDALPILGNTLGFTKVADSNCSTHCTANLNEICGGPWLNNIYTIESTPTPTTSSAFNFTLFNNNTHQPVAGYNPIAPGATINLAQVGSHL